MELRKPIDLARANRNQSRLRGRAASRAFGRLACLVSMVALAGCGTEFGSSASREPIDSVAQASMSTTRTSPGPESPESPETPETPTTAWKSRLVLGSPEPGLVFEAPAKRSGELQNVSPLTLSVPSETTIAQTATAAAELFGDAIVEGRTSDAFELLPDLEQRRVGSAKKFEEILSRESTWLSSTVDPAQTAGGVVALLITQTPTIDEIRGVIAPASVVKIPAIKEAIGWRVSWEKRTVSQQFGASPDRLETAVLRWATNRQNQCPKKNRSSATTQSFESGNDPSLQPVPEGEYAGGLLGAVWLAEELCTVPGAVTISMTGDIYNLDDPQPLLDAYGGGAYQWARVVTLAAPHAMHVIAAPLGDQWVVVGISPVSSF